MASSTKKQLEILDTYIKYSKPYDKLTTFEKRYYTHEWKELVYKLNIYGPPSRDIKEWKKIWNHRRKLMENKIKQTRGSPLNEKDKATDAACGMEASVSGIVGGVSIRTNRNINESNDEVDEMDEMDEVDEVDPLIHDLTHSQSGDEEEDLRVIDVLKNLFTKHLQAQHKANEALSQIRDAILKLAEATEKKF